MGKYTMSTHTKKICTFAIVITTALIVVLFILYFNLKYSSFDYQVGDSVSYVNVSDCPEYSRLVINSKNLKAIHKCEEETIKIDDQNYYYVNLDLGPADDCPSGCIYERQNFLVDKNKLSIIPMPNSHNEREIFSKLNVFLRSNNGLLSDGIITVLYGIDYPDFESDKSLSAKVGKLRDNFGWVIRSNKFFNGGSVFYFIKDKKYYWDISNLKTKVSNIDEVNTNLIKPDGYFICPNFIIEKRETYLCNGNNAIKNCYIFTLKCPNNSSVYVNFDSEGTMFYSGPEKSGLDKIY
jgi:hypothetical protein